MRSGGDGTGRWPKVGTGRWPKVGTGRWPKVGTGRWPKVTARGLGAASVAAGLAAAALALGVQELFPLAAALAVSIAAGFAFAASRPALPDHLYITRRTTPLVSLGQPAQAQLRAANLSGSPTPAVMLRSVSDFVAETTALRRPRPPARVLRAPGLHPGEAFEVDLPLPTTRRGVWALGRLEAVTADPLGLWERTVEVAPPRYIVVHPALTKLAPLPTVPRWGTTGPLPGRSLAGGDDELSSLRPYVAGDDLRRVHWRTSARAGRLMVRQGPVTGTMAVTVLVDGGHGPARATEKCLSVAASLVALCLATEGVTLSLVTTEGDSAGPGSGAGLRAESLEILSLAGPAAARTGPWQWPGPADLAIVVSPDVDKALALVAYQPAPAPVTLAVGAGNSPTSPPLARSGRQRYRAAGTPGVLVLDASAGLAQSWAAVLPALGAHLQMHASHARPRPGHPGRAVRGAWPR